MSVVKCLGMILGLFEQRLSIVDGQGPPQYEANIYLGYDAKAGVART